MKGGTNCGVGGSGKSSIIVSAPSGSVVYTENQDGKRKNASEKNGLWAFSGCDVGTWTVYATLNGEVATQTVIISEENQLVKYYVNIGYQLFASDFDWASYGVLNTDYQIVTDDDVEIPQSEWPTAKNWKARLLTSGTLKAKKAGKIDVFGVGGGGGSVPIVEGKQETHSGGPGYSATETVEITAADYAVTIGAGGSGGTNSGSSGGTTTAFGVTANGGNGASSTANGTGGTATGEFGGTSPRTYCQIPADYMACQPNTGDGGAKAAKYTTGNAGGSGIVIIRNARG